LAGTIYILFLIANLELRWDALNDLPGQINVFATALWRPSDGEFVVLYYRLWLAADRLLTVPTDAWATIATTIVIPFVKQMQKTQVPASFVDALLWLPSKIVNKKYVTYAEVGSPNYIKCSNFVIVDHVFEAVEKQ